MRIVRLLETSNQESDYEVGLDEIVGWRRKATDDWAQTTLFFRGGGTVKIWQDRVAFDSFRGLKESGA